MDNTKQCENGCKTCMTVSHYELDTFFECDEGMVMTGFVDAVYGDSAVLPQFEYDNHPGMCFQSMIPTGDACRADKQEVLDVLHRQCAGQSRCFIYSGDMNRLLGHRYCPGKAMNLTGIAKCMYTDTR